MDLFFPRKRSNKSFKHLTTPRLLARVVGGLQRYCAGGGFKPGTFEFRVRCSYHSATPQHDAVVEVDTLSEP